MTSLFRNAVFWHFFLTYVRIQGRKRNVIFPIDFGFHAFGREIFIPVIPHTSRIASAPHTHPPKELRLPDHLFAQIMFVRSRSIASTASCLSRDRRSYRSSLIADKSRSTLTCVTGSAASTGLQLHRSRVGWDDVPRIPFVKISMESGKVINDGSRERASEQSNFE